MPTILGMLVSMLIGWAVMAALTAFGIWLAYAIGKHIDPLDWLVAYGVCCGLVTVDVIRIFRSEE